MTNAQVLEELIKYIDDETYNYAVLVDGEWGSGKTFFVKNECIPVIESHEQQKDNPRKVHYISLYGLNSAESIIEKILCERLLKTDIADKKLKLGKHQKVKSISAITVKLLLSNGATFVSGINEAIGDLLSDQCIFVFDDLERCNCSQDITMGIINDLVEHGENKMIIIANEQELMETHTERYNEILYQLALSDKIEWPEDTVSAIFGTTGIKKVGGLDKEELDRRVKYLFGNKNENIFYQRTREKVIGVAYRYEPDLERVLPVIIDSCKLDSEKKQILLGLVQEMISTMSNRRHRNIRTFLFFLSRISYIFGATENLEINDEYRNDVLVFLTRDTFNHALDYKGPPREYQTRYEFLTYTHRFTSSALKTFIVSGNLDRDKMQDEINEYIEAEIKERVGESDSLTKLERDWYIMSDEDCRAHVDSVLKKLKEDKYPVSAYVFIIAMLLRLREIGFDGKMVDDARECIIANIRNNSKYKGLSAETIHMETETLQGQLRDEVDLINDKLRYHIEEREQNALSIIIDEDKWVEALMDYGRISDGMHYEDKPIFSKLPVEIWTRRIVEASAEELDNFRQYLHRIYPVGITRRSLQDDRQTMKGIIDEVSEHTDTDIIKRKQLEWLLGAMRNIINETE